MINFSRCVGARLSQARKWINVFVSQRGLFHPVFDSPQSGDNVNQIIQLDRMVRVVENCGGQIREIHTLKISSRQRRLQPAKRTNTLGMPARIPSPWIE